MPTTERGVFRETAVAFHERSGIPGRRTLQGRPLRAPRAGGIVSVLAAAVCLAALAHYLVTARVPVEVDVDVLVLATGTRGGTTLPATAAERQVVAVFPAQAADAVRGGTTLHVTGADGASGQAVIAVRGSGRIVTAAQVRATYPAFARATGLPATGTVAQGTITQGTITQGAITQGTITQGAITQGAIGPAPGTPFTGRGRIAEVSVLALAGRLLPGGGGR